MLIRRVEKEASQTFYAMTKDYDGRKNRTLTPVEKKTLLDMKPDDFTFEYLVNTFGVVSDGKSVFSPKFKCGDRFVLNPGEYPGAQGSRPGAFPELREACRWRAGPLQWGRCRAACAIPPERAASGEIPDR